MSGRSNTRWLLTVGLFACLNSVGLIIIVSQLERRTRLQVVETFSASLDAPVFIRFNQRMVTQQEVGSATPKTSLSVDPPLEGSAFWADPFTLSYRPAMRQRPATRYKFHFSKELRSLLGNSLGASNTFSYETLRPALESASQVGRTESGGVRLRLVFNQRVLPADVADILKLVDSEGKPVAFRATSQQPDRQIHVETDPTAGKSLIVRLPAGLVGLDGPLPADQEFAQQIDIVASLRIYGLHATHRGAGVVVRVSSSHPIDPEGAKPFIRVDPPVDFTCVAQWGDLVLQGDFSPGERYRITLAQGLKGASGGWLDRDFTRSFFAPDREPEIAFRSGGIYLGAAGSRRLPILTVNTPAFKLTARRIYESNLVHFLRERPSSGVAGDLGASVAEKHCRPEGAKNQEVETLVDVADLLGNDARGAYLLSAAPENRYWGSRDQVVLLTDLGVSVKFSRRDALVWVNALSTAKPVEGARVVVYSRASQPLAEGVTSAEGLTHLEGSFGSEEHTPFAVVASKDGDVAAIRLDRMQVDHAPFDTGGRAYLAGGYEAFVHTDRGIYRPGETVRLRALVRGLDGAAPQPFPPQWRILRPDGQVFLKLSGMVSASGSLSANVELPDYAMTGRYRAKALLPGGEVLGQETFQVEEFMPNRMEAKVSCDERRYGLGEEVAFTVSGTHFFGAPAAGRRVEARWEVVSEDFTHEDWSGYSFVDESRPSVRLAGVLPSADLDSDGKATFSVNVPDDLAPPSALGLRLQASVREIGGRAVTARLARHLDAYPLYLGVAKVEEHATAGRPAHFRAVALSPDGNAVPLDQVRVSVEKIEWSTVLKKDDNGRYRYESSENVAKLTGWDMALEDGVAEIEWTPKFTGTYRLRVEDQASGAAATTKFYCGGDSMGAWSMEKPDRLEIVPDKPVYSEGDTAAFLVKAPFPGRMLFTLESDRILAARTIDMETNTAHVEMRVPDTGAANIYCAATVIRKIEPASKWSPHRARGVAPVRIARESRRLRVEVDAPDEIRPGDELRVRAHVGQAGAEVALALVDEGVLQLTGFKTPDPWVFFYGKRRLDVTAADAYSALMPEIDTGKVGTDSDEGGDGANEPRRLLNPISVKRVDTVALWRGDLVADANGMAEAAFSAPDFDGRLRVMAVASAEARFGAAERAVLVRQPLMLRASLPRFLAPGDEFALPVTIFKRTGEDGEVEIDVEATNIEILAESARRHRIKQDGEVTDVFHARASEHAAPAAIRIAARLGDEETARTVQLAIRPPVALTRLSGSSRIEAGETTTVTVPMGWLAGTGRTRLTVASAPTLELGGALNYLLRYPHGCLEQTASRALPLLYLADLARLSDPDLFDGAEIADYVQGGVDRVLSMQTHDGGFGWWPGAVDSDSWCSAYAAHFLVEAEKGGYPVRPEARDAALEHLRDILGRTGSSNALMAAKAYAAYVLALAGQADHSWTQRLVETMEELPQYSRCQLASALVLMNKAELARGIVEGYSMSAPHVARETGGALHSPVRGDAILLGAYLDAAPNHSNVERLVQRLKGAMRDGRWGTTQENAFAVLALGKYARSLDVDGSEYTGAVWRGKEMLGAFADHRPLSLELDDRGEIEVRSEGKGAFFCLWQSEGVPTGGTAREEDRGVKVRRRFFDRDGQAADISALTQGEMLVVEIALEAPQPLKNVIVADLLPAGLEIENPRLETSEALSLGGETLRPTHIDMRDDRLLLFTDLAGEKVYRYVARAVTAGRFSLPAISALCMYDGDIRSVSGAGELRVVGAGPLGR